MLAGRVLTPLQVLQVTNTFARAVIPETVKRASTPLPDPEPQPDPAACPSPWTINKDDCKELSGNSSRPRLTGG